MASQGPGTFWDSVRAWADSAGITVAAAAGEGPSPPPSVPESVCANCPICQGAATLEQINPAIVEDLTSLAHSLLGGIGSALAVASEQRHRLSESDTGPQSDGSAPEGDSPASDHQDAGSGAPPDPLTVPDGPPVAGPEARVPGKVDPQATPSAGRSAPAA